MSADVLVLGAGIAGLAAADRLAAAGRRVVLLEARDRVGGRIRTVPDPELGRPVELGPEFVHGRPAELLALIRDTGLHTDEVPERRQRGPGRGPTPLPDIHSALDRLIHRCAAGPDRPVAEPLAEYRADGGQASELDAVVQYLEGFHAADLARMGTRSLAENEAAADQDGDGMYRVREGYAALTQAMMERLDASLVELRLETPVRAIQWRPGQVRASLGAARGVPAEAVAPRAIVTLPLPVLTRRAGEPGAVPIEPVPPGWRQELAALHMGAAHHVALGFDARWWVRDDEDGASFIHGAGEPFPVWWTSLPSHAPLLTGWTGGPHAAALAGLGHEALVNLALDSLASVFGRDAFELRSRLRRAHLHDWMADPLAGGAYSYGGVGAMAARAALVRPVADTLYLAGEAVAEGGRNATVHGALASGRRAADLLLASAGRREGTD